MCSGLFWTTLSGAEIVVFVSIAPQAFFVEQVGGSHVQVHTLVKPGQNPHTFEPTPRQLVALSEAAVYFTCGLPFEQRLLAKIRDRYQQLEIVDTSSGITRRTRTEVSLHGHGAHQQEHGDPHIWLSPKLIKIQAENICQGLGKLDPANRVGYQSQLNTFLQAIDQVDQEIGQLLAPYQGQSFYVFHPSFGHFAAAYNLKQKAVEVEGKSPTPRQITALIRQAKQEQVKIIFVQPQFDRKSALVIARAIEGAVIPIDSLAYDVLQNLKIIAAQLKKALHNE
ncbi:metal ABC transporter solute-binding protein, Zn/Mn family [candidate division CSSED10-310 bacterium]|uniref:Metal ABC transporter solute-binding protein, Zn/Mn family n=1 Tax=candidate division CSSED10-310 bacterium TaxID=2855610 RepID=A0ABV6YZR3_UNCC1